MSIEVSIFDGDGENQTEKDLHETIKYYGKNNVECIEMESGFLLSELIPHSEYEVCDEEHFTDPGRPDGFYRGIDIYEKEGYSFKRVRIIVHRDICEHCNHEKFYNQKLDRMYCACCKTPLLQRIEDKLKSIRFIKPKAKWRLWR